MAAYSTANPPALIAQGIGGVASQRVWILSGVHVTTDADADGFITNASDLGMKVGDTVLLANITTPATTLVHQHVVNSVTAGGAGNLSVGTATGVGGTSGD
jgi:hypothetical protein